MTRGQLGVVELVETDVAVIGSGAGGAVSAARLAKAGRDVVILEEGADLDPDGVEPFSIEEMATKYRHRGLAAALGSPNVVYAEGKCVGGTTEINSGLYRRAPEELIEGWRRAFRIDEFSAAQLGHYSDEIERELGVSAYPHEPPLESALLVDGAHSLGWRAEEFERTFRYPEAGPARKQSMARTYVPAARAAGARLMAECKVERLITRGRRVNGVQCTVRDGNRTRRVDVRARHVFVCGGAIQTPVLLQRSGIHGVGRGLRFHPTIKIAARFPFVVGHDDVPMHRITEFSPFISIGGSASRRGHLALALRDTGLDCDSALEDWKRVCVYYAAIRAEAAGRIIALPGLPDPLVLYRLTEADLSRLARGVIHLGEALLAAGATELYPGIAGGPVVRSVSELAAWWDGVSRQRANVMTVHLTSSVRMGENVARAGCDSFGRLHGWENLRVNDASLLPDAPGVNPQASIMAIAARNVDAFLALAN